MNTFIFYKGNKVLTCLDFHLIATSKLSLVKRWNFFGKYFDFILLVSQNGNSIKIKDFGILKKFAGIT